MKNRYLSALQSSTLSILPIVVIVLILSIPALNVISLQSWDYVMLLVGTLALIIGLSLFQIGAQTGLIKVLYQSKLLYL